MDHQPACRTGTKRQGLTDRKTGIGTRSPESTAVVVVWQLELEAIAGEKKGAGIQVLASASGSSSVLNDASSESKDRVLLCVRLCVYLLWRRSRGSE